MTNMGHNTHGPYGHEQPFMVNEGWNFFAAVAVNRERWRIWELQWIVVESAFSRCKTTVAAPTFPLTKSNEVKN